MSTRLKKNHATSKITSALSIEVARPSTSKGLPGSCRISTAMKSPIRKMRNSEGF